MKIAIIVGGWYFPDDFYRKLSCVIPPPGCDVDKFVVMHRSPYGINPTEMLDRIETPNIYDSQLYSKICTQDKLFQYKFHIELTENMIGDYYFFNQWAEKHDYTKYDYCLFLHDDNFLLPSFTEILLDFLSNSLPLYKFVDNQWILCDTKIPYQSIDYIANSAVGWRKTARGSFSIWSKRLLDSLGGKFPMDGVTLSRTGLIDTPLGKEDTEDWNNVGLAFQRFIENNNYMDSTYRLSKLYRTSKYMLEAERGLISNHGVSQLKNDTLEGIKLYG